MEIKKREIRRHHKKRLAKKRLSYFILENQDSTSIRGKLIKTPKPCSCFMCGNPRKFLKNKTVKEKQFYAIDIN